MFFISMIALISQSLFSQIPGSFEPVSPLEQRQLVEMLQAAELDSGSVCFEKDWDLTCKFKNSLQMQMLNNPWAAFSEVGKMRALCASDTLSMDIGKLWDPLSRLALGLGELNTEINALTQYQKVWDSKVKKPKDIFQYISGVYDDAERERAKAFAKLSPAQKDSLTVFFYSMWQESDDRERNEAFFRDHHLTANTEIDLDRFAELFQMVDMESLYNAGQYINAGFEVLNKHAGELRYKNKRPILRKTKYGLMIIGSTKSDTYKDHCQQQNICFILEPGGDDTYEIGLKTDWEHPFYLMLDLAGDDIYRNGQIGESFCVVGGIGISLDVAGNDVYRTDDFSFCSFLGMMMHRDLAGADVYQGGLFTQAAAMFGLALLIDEAGSDSYAATSFAQGLGGTMGVGALLDYMGDDVYYIGGKYLHKPLMPLDYRSMGQGMGFGLRPDYAGGLGLLYDRNGNDKYLGGVYAQGVGYWYAVGMLIDEKGNDVYNAIYYPQGSGIHLACGVLFDGEGDDNYYTRNGPGQGAGHDWSFGMLVDKGGNDSYSIPGGNGLGLSNSVGIFVDSSGDDRYERKVDNSLGFANLSRGTGGIGLFLDAGGKDSYPDSLYANNKQWQRGSYGIGKDMELNIVALSKVEELAVQVSAEIDSLAEIAEIFAIASEWEVGSSVQRVRKARSILKARETEAADYIVTSKLATESGLEYRAMDALVKESVVFKEKLFTTLSSSDSLTVKNAIALIAGTADSTLIDFLGELLLQKKYVPAALSALGSIQTQSSLDLLTPFVAHSSERYRFIAARSLMNLKSPEAAQLLQSLRDDPSFLVRTLVRNIPSK